MRALPGLLAGTRAASDDVTALARALSPVAAALRRAAPDVDAALRELPGTTADLRGLLPALQGVLDDAPATLDRVPAAGEQARALVPPATELLRDLNPALRYLEPYGADVAQFVTNFGAGIHHHDEYGQSYIALQPVLGPFALRPNPVPLPPGVTANENAYPHRRLPRRPPPAGPVHPARTRCRPAVTARSPERGDRPGDLAVGTDRLVVGRARHSTDPGGVSCSTTSALRCATA